MKILIIRTTPDKVDFTNVTYNRQQTGLAKAFNRLGHKCDIVYFGGKEEKQLQLEYAPGKTFTVYLVRGTAFLKNGIYRAKDLDAIISGYDMLQVECYDQIESWRLAKRYPHKMVVYNGTYYSDFNRRYNKKCAVVDKLFVPRYIKNDIVFVTKNQMSADFLKAKGIKTAVSIGVGLDTDQLAISDELESELSLKLDTLKQDNRLLLYVGKLEPRRNVPFLFKTFAEVKKRNPKTKLVIVGRGDAEYVESCFALARELGVYDDIIWVERLEQKYLSKIYKSCDVFLLPTLYEIFGMVLLEAMYFGIPVVTSLNGGSDILIKGRNNGCIVEPFDVVAWADEIERLLGDPILYRTIGENAHTFISQEFTWDALAEKFLAVYREKLGTQI